MFETLVQQIYINFFNQTKRLNNRNSRSEMEEAVYKLVKNKPTIEQVDTDLLYVSLHKMIYIHPSSLHCFIKKRLLTYP